MRKSKSSKTLAATFASLLTCIILSSCAGAPQKTVAPELNVFRDMDVTTSLPEVELKEVPEKPSAVTINIVDDGEQKQVLGFAPEEAKKLIAYQVATVHNSTAAYALVKTISAMESERRALIEAGRAVEREANYLNRRLYDTSQQLDDEKKEHAIDNLVNRVLQVILAALVFL